jgi:hypothetical protein
MIGYFLRRFIAGSPLQGARGRDGLEQVAVDNVIEEMVFIGGTLNLKLLGGSSELMSNPHEPSASLMKTAGERF